MKSITLSWLFCLAVVLMPAVPAGAQTPAAKSHATAVPSGRAVFDKPAGAAVLDTYRGGQLVQNNMRLAGTTAGNTAEQVFTGDNTIGSGAFTNMSGFAVTVQNSGANVLIQNAVILNLQMN